MSLIARNASNALFGLCSLVKKTGIETRSERGMVKAIPCPVHVQMFDENDEFSIFPILKSRKFNPEFCIGEARWMFDGSNNAHFLDQFSKGYADKYSDDGIMHGAYGYRLINDQGLNQIEKVIELLNNAPNTRRAVLSMWKPELDCGNQKVSDRPCNLQVIFQRSILNPSKLDMCVTSRSADVIFGFSGSDLPYFSLLHAYIASQVGLEIGVYHHISNNFHIYDRHFVMMEEIIEEYQDKAREIDRAHFCINEQSIFRNDFESLPYQETRIFKSPMESFEFYAMNQNWRNARLKVKKNVQV